MINFIYEEGERVEKILYPADTYIVINKTILNNEDRLILLKLYEPVGLT